MDEKLNTLWKEGKYPFNQPIFTLDDLIEISQLLQCLRKIFDYLITNFSNATLYLNHDWHEHDGYIMNSDKISWNHYRKKLQDIQTLYNSRDGDAHVRITIYPHNKEFILRYYILEEDEDDEYPGIWGSFDLAIDNEHLENIENLIDEIGVEYIISNSKQIFDQGYRG